MEKQHKKWLRSEVLTLVGIIVTAAVAFGTALITQNKNISQTANGNSAPVVQVAGNMNIFSQFPPTPVLTDENKKQLLTISKSNLIVVSTIADSSALRFGLEIQDFLKTNGYTNLAWGTCYPAEIFHGTNIQPGLDGSYHICVGLQN